MMWKVSFGQLPASAAVFAAAMIGAVAIQSAAAGAQQAPEPDRDPQFIYDRTCGYCHGHNVGPILLGRDLQPAIIEYFVRNGNGAMPAFRPTEITPSELTALADWISTSDVDAEEHGQ